MKTIQESRKIESVRSPHVRYHWESSKDDKGILKYGVLVVSKYRVQREEIMDRIFGDIASIHSGIEVLREVEGSILNSHGLRYLFNQFDTPVKPSEIQWHDFGLPVVRDRGLYERVKKGASVEAYIESLFS
ncbi:MAG: hypothetical protein WDZ77_01610 [Candidatus Pacearchaeota archaeon]